MLFLISLFHPCSSFLSSCSQLNLLSWENPQINHTDFLKMFSLLAGQDLLVTGKSEGFLQIRAKPPAIPIEIRLFQFTPHRKQYPAHLADTYVPIRTPQMPVNKLFCSLYPPSLLLFVCNLTYPRYHLLSADLAVYQNTKKDTDYHPIISAALYPCFLAGFCLKVLLPAHAGTKFDFLLYMQKKVIISISLYFYI